MLCAREMREIPTGRDQIRAHAHDRMNIHSHTLRCNRVPLVYNQPVACRPRPETVVDESVRLLDVRAVIREATFWARTDLPPGCARDTFDVERYLDVLGDVRSDGELLRFSACCVFGGGVSDREVVGLACTLVRADGEVGEVYGTPDLLLCVWVVELKGELDCWVP